jgi:hypothetical protein
VKVGSTAGNMIAVEGEGLSDGMVVVIRGNERIFPGSPVRTADVSGGNDESTSKESGGGEES